MLNLSTVTIRLLKRRKKGLSQVAQMYQGNKSLKKSPYQKKISKISTYKLRKH